MVSKLLILLFSLFSIIILGVSLFLPVESEVNRLLLYFDFVLCLFFIYDFFKQLYQAEHKWKYLYTNGWLDLLSSIPIISETRLFRFFRIVRIFRIIRSIGSFKAIFNFVKDEVKQSIFGLLIFIQITGLFIITLLVLYIEKGPGNIKTAEDAMWWAFITFTTVGYGDHYPVTNVGRFLTVLLTILGVLSFGALISYLNSLFRKLK
jgi:voltage-gated potassium channel